MGFSAELRERRLNRQWSLRDACKRTGGALSFTMLSRYERGIKLGVMSVRHAQAISKLFKWNMSDMSRKITEETQQKEPASAQI